MRLPMLMPVMVEFRAKLIVAGADYRASVLKGQGRVIKDMPAADRSGDHADPAHDRALWDSCSSPFFCAGTMGP